MYYYDTLCVKMPPKISVKRITRKRPGTAKQGQQQQQFVQVFVQPSRRKARSAAPRIQQISTYPLIPSDTYSQPILANQLANQLAQSLSLANKQLETLKIQPSVGTRQVIAVDPVKLQPSNPEVISIEPTLAYEPPKVDQDIISKFESPMKPKSLFPKPPPGFDPYRSPVRIGQVMIEKKEAPISSTKYAKAAKMEELQKRKDLRKVFDVMKQRALQKK